MILVTPNHPTGSLQGSSKSHSWWGGDRSLSAKSYLAVGLRPRISPQAAAFGDDSCSLGIDVAMHSVVLI